jgi:hypothetical protein
LSILQSEKKTYQLQLFSGVEHGFALRGNMNNAHERKFAAKKIKEKLLTKLGYVKEQSLKGIMDWFNFWLSQ